MAGLSDFRAQHPEYNDMSDADLSNALYKKFYSDIPRDQFDAKMGGAAPVEGFGQKVYDFAQGVGKGAFSLPQNAVELGAKALDGLGVTEGAAGNVQTATDAANARALKEAGTSPNSGSMQAGEPVGKVMASLPLAAVAPFSGAGILPALGNGALQGAVGGALSGDPNSVGSNAALGAATGGGGAAALTAAARALTPLIRPAVTALSNNGVSLTPGQLFGGWAKGLEDRASGLPFIGDPIKSAQRDGLRQFGNGAGNIAMGGIGPIPEGISGQAMSTTAHQLFDDAYGQVLPQLNVTLDHNFANAIGNTSATVDARLPETNSEQFQSTLADVFHKLNAGQAAPTNSFPGRAAKDAYSDLGFLSRDYQKPTATPNDAAMGRAYGDVQDAFRQAFQNSDPWAAGSLQNIDTAYRNFIPVDKAIARASGNGGGLEAGVFTPGQLRSAVVGSDNSVRKVASSQGGGPLQQYAEHGIEVLPSSVPDSGTAGRLGLLALLNEPHLAIPAIATHLLYNRPVLGALNNTFANGQGATGLASLFRNLAAAGPAPLGASLSGGGQ